MSRINTFSPDSMRTIAREVFREARESRAPRLQDPQIIQPYEQRKVQFRNTSGEIIPAYGVMRVTGVELKAGLPIITVAKPSTTFDRLYLVNGSMRVGSASTCRGVGTWLYEGGYALYESGTPAYGESWGPKDGQWSLAKWRYGFTIWGATTGSIGSGTARVIAVQAEVNEVYGQTNGAMALDGTGTVDLYDGNNTAITSTSITATNRFVTSVATAKKVICTWIGGTWLASAAKCV